MRIRDLIYEYERVPMAEVPDPLGGSEPEPVAVPGNEEPDVEPVAPTSDETLTTEPGSTPPASVPYDRFREVNEARKQALELAAPLTEFEQQGYPVEELQRLTQWETEFAQDPVQVWLRTAQSIEDLPEGIKEAIAAHTGEPVTPAATPVDPAPGTEQNTADEDVPSWAQELLEDKRKREEAEAEAARTREAEQRQTQARNDLTKITETWKKMDEKDSITTPEKAMMAHIMAAARVTETTEECLALARKEYLESREEMLGDVVVRPGQRPRPLPGSATLTPTQQPKAPRTLREASKLAEATWEDEVAQ